MWRYLKEFKGINKENAPESFSIIVWPQQHDHGTYYEVAAKFSVDNEVACDLAYWLESNSPTYWDQEARVELQLDDPK